MERLPSRISQESPPTAAIRRTAHISLIFSHLAAHAAASALFITVRERERRRPKSQRRATDGAEHPAREADGRRERKRQEREVEEEEDEDE